MNPLLRLVAAFPQPPVDKVTIQLYAEKLGKEKDLHVCWACEKAIETCKHFPRLSELLDFIKAKKIEEYNAGMEEKRKRLLSEPVNPNRPKLMDLLDEQRRKRGGDPRKLFGDLDGAGMN